LHALGSVASDISHAFLAQLGSALCFPVAPYITNTGLAAHLPYHTSNWYAKPNPDCIYRETYLDLFGSAYCVVRQDPTGRYPVVEISHRTSLSLIR